MINKDFYEQAQETIEQLLKNLKLDHTIDFDRLNRVLVECQFRLISGKSEQCQVCQKYFNPDYMVQDGCFDCSDIMNNR